ncbi:MAG: hypothetical protein JWO94_1039 [Verrucomicrobiaceae bacterium]|nr:hypothetical protein [Verrucomicrobiaceae bacterium]
MTEPFSSFMQRALYDPQRGYYTARIKTVGARGDFSTSATLSTLLGQAVARWLLDEARQTGVRTIIEVGGGDGSLMSAVLAGLGWWQRRGFQVFMVDASPILLQQQKQRLGRRVKAWFGTLPEALAACAGEALIFNNELLDAFPVEIVQARDNAWHEVWLHHEAGAITEELRPLTHPEEPYRVLQVKPAGRCELHTAVHGWLAHWMPGWKKGAMLTIDYGDLFPTLYHRRPRGTLRGYLMQQCLTGPEVYLNPGRQDITCDVNFTDVRAWLAALGAQETSFETQANFIRRLAPVPGSARDAFVTHEQGAGSAFKCLAVRRSPVAMATNSGEGKTLSRT